MSAIVDRVLAALKWPVGVASALLLPGLGLSLLDRLQASDTRSALVPFLVGVAVYSVAWLAYFRRPAFAGFFSTMEHELTHALFAWATLHRVVGFWPTWRSGGRVRHLGKGNWLIAIGPCFFPTLSVVVALTLALLSPGRAVGLGGALLGAALAHHATATWSRESRHHADIREAGSLFACLFLPSACVLMFGMLLGLVLGGGRSIGGFLDGAAEHSSGFLHWLWSVILKLVSP